MESLLIVLAQINIIVTVRNFFLFNKDFFFFSPGVNFINILRTNFSYKRRFGSFYYVHVTRKKAAEMTFVQKTRSFNVDEIDISEKKK